MRQRCHCNPAMDHVVDKFVNLASSVQAVVWTWLLLLLLLPRTDSFYSCFLPDCRLSTLWFALRKPSKMESENPPLESPAAPARPRLGTERFTPCYQCVSRYAFWKTDTEIPERCVDGVRDALGLSCLECEREAASSGRGDSLLCDAVSLRDRDRCQSLVADFHSLAEQLEEFGRLQTPARRCTQAST